MIPQQLVLYKKYKIVPLQLISTKCKKEVNSYCLGFYPKQTHKRDTPGGTPNKNMKEIHLAILN